MAGYSHTLSTIFVKLFRNVCGTRAAATIYGRITYDFGITPKLDGRRYIESSRLHISITDSMINAYLTWYA
jgi:hypothetical protein